MKNYYIFLRYNHYLCPQVRFYHIENILRHLNGLRCMGFPSNPVAATPFVIS
jgi:hypothetical protein